MDSERHWMYLRKDKKGFLTKGYDIKVKEFVDFALTHPECMDGSKIKCPCNRRECRNIPFLEPDVVKYHLVSKGFLPNYHRWDFHGEVLLKPANYVSQPPWEDWSSSRKKRVLSSNACPSSSHYPNTNGYTPVTYQDFTGPYNNDNMYEPDSSDMSGHNTHSTQEDQPNTYEGYHQMVQDAFGPDYQYPPPSVDEPPNPEAKKFYKAMDDLSIPLYEGCKHTRLSVMTRLSTIKSNNGWSESSFDQVASLMSETMPDGNIMPQSFYETKKLVESLGLPAEKIDCCTNGCMLYWGEDSERTTCKVCTRPKGGKYSTMWYFPLIPRLQRLYASEATATHMRWHAEHESEYGTMNHPSDAEAWRTFNENHPYFANETRNVRLALCTDGFMPFGQFARQYSCWPVFINPYNLPPGMCMKEEHMFMTVLVPGPRNPKQKIDIYLQPLIAELNQLWHNGALTYDSSRKQNFMMHAALMWTISDFPAYEMLSGWSTQGHLACPVCMEDNDAFTLHHGKKQSWFDNHRKFLPRDHRWRKDEKNFKKGEIVTKVARAPKTGEEILAWIEELGLRRVTEPDWEAHNSRINKQNEGSGWKKRSLLWDLPYWKTNMIRHCLDVMHIEKNCFENVFNTLMDIKGKTKDNHNSRKDLQTFCNRPKYDKNNKGFYPPGDYMLNKKQIAIFSEWVKNLKFPDGYVSNMSRCFENNKYQSGGMKSHDCHVFMQRLLPVAFRNFLDPVIWEALTEFSLFFKDLTCTSITVQNMNRLKRDIPVILCKLEKIFPPSFFDSMEHLTVHLPYEAMIAGPVHYRWMYPYERLLKNKKKNLGNMAQVEGSIANAYLSSEIAYFGSLYFEPEVYTRSRKLKRNDDGGDKEVIPGNLSIFAYPGRTSGKGRRRFLTDQEYKAAGTYILLNCPEVDIYVDIYKGLLRDGQGIQSEDVINEQVEHNFMDWFQTYVAADTRRINNNEFIYALSQGSLRHNAKSYPIYFVNGYKFQTMRRGSNKVTTNSGVCLKSEGGEFYGVVKEIIELEYPRVPIKKTVVFKCDWRDASKNGTRYHKRYDIVDVNVNRHYAKYDPFILASQASQVCYIPYPSESTSIVQKEWMNVCKVKARGIIHKSLTQVVVESAFQEDDAVGHSIVSNNFLYVDLGDLVEANNNEEWNPDSDDEHERQSQTVADISDTSEEEIDHNSDDDDDNVDEEDEHGDFDDASDNY